MRCSPSSDDGSTYDIYLEFTGVRTGDEFRAETGADDGRIKGSSWSQQQDDWAFAEIVGGTIEVLSGVEEEERIVMSSQFLIDSESNFQEAAKKLLAAESMPEEAGRE